MQFKFQQNNHYFFFQEEFFSQIYISNKFFYRKLESRIRKDESSAGPSLSNTKTIPKGNWKKKSSRY
jgi:hypothetical protein